MNRRRKRHLSARTLFENFVLFLSLGILLLTIAEINMRAPLVVVLPLVIGALLCFVASVMRFICYGLEWCVNKGWLKEPPEKRK